MEQVRGRINLACVLDKSNLKFLEDNGILSKLLEERKKFIEGKERSIDNSHKDILLNIMCHQRPKSSSEMIPKFSKPAEGQNKVIKSERNGINSICEGDVKHPYKANKDNWVPQHTMVSAYLPNEHSLLLLSHFNQIKITMVADLFYSNI